MNNPMMKQIYISLLDCKSNLIEIEPEQALFLPIFGEHRVKKITPLHSVNGPMAQE